MANGNGNTGGFAQDNGDSDYGRETQRVQLNPGQEPKSKNVPKGQIYDAGDGKMGVRVSIDGSDPSTRVAPPSHPSMREPNVTARLQFLGDGTSVYTEERNDVAPVSPGTGGNVVRTEDGRVISDFVALSAASGMTAVVIEGRKMSLVEAQARGVLVRDERGQLRLAQTSTVVPQQTQPTVQPTQQQQQPPTQQPQAPVEVPLPVEAANILGNIHSAVGEEGLFGYAEAALTEGTERISHQLAADLHVSPEEAKARLDSIVGTFRGQWITQLGLVSDEEGRSLEAYLNRPEIKPAAMAARRSIVGKGDFSIARTLLAAARNSGDIYTDSQLSEMVNGAGIRTWTDQSGTLMCSLNGQSTRLRAALKSGRLTITPNRA